MTELSTQDREYSTTGTIMGSTDAFDEIYTTFYPQIVGLLRQQVAHDIAEDVAQETFVKAFKSLDRYEERGALSGWLTTVAKNALVDHYRRRGTRQLDVTDDTDRLDRVAPDYGAEPGTTVVLDDSRDEILANIIANTTEDQAEIFSLMIDGYTAKEISEILGVPRATVRTRVHRGRKTLRAAGINPPE